MNRRPGAKPHGEIRQSQVITTFGPGAMLDLPNHSVLIAGLDHWSRGGDEIAEPRLAAKLALLLDIPSVRLITPPIESEDPAAPSTCIDCFQFPEWFITQDVESLDGDASRRSRMLVHRKALTRGKFIDRSRKKRAVVPVRFVRACRHATSATSTGTPSPTPAPPTAPPITASCGSMRGAPAAI